MIQLDFVIQSGIQNSGAFFNFDFNLSGQVGQECYED